MKLNNLLPVLIVALLSSGLITSKVYADYLPESSKEVGGYIKIKGWDKVSDYILVQPIGSWSSCDANASSDATMRFRLLNDGHIYDFGFESHSSQYYGIAAINKQNISDISVVRSDPKYPRQDEYLIYCNSEAYKNSLYTSEFESKEIPHGDMILKKEDPINRIDYVVTFTGINQSKKSVDFDVSAPINRTSLASADAIAFEKSIGITQKIDVKIYDWEMEMYKKSSELTKAKDDLKKCTNANTSVNKTTPEIKTTKAPVSVETTPSVIYFAGISLSILTGLVGFFIGKKFSKKPITPPANVI